MKAHWSKRFGSSPGSSINEILVTMTLLGMFVLTLFGFYRSQLLSLQGFRTQVDVKERAHAGLGFLINEIRMAGSRPLPEDYPPADCDVPAAPAVPGVVCDGFAAIEKAGPTMIKVQYDYRDEDLTGDPDGCPDDPNEVVEYSYDVENRRILREADGASNPIAEGVSLFELRYFGRDGTEIPNGSDELTDAERLDGVASIVFTLTVESPSLSPVIEGDVRSRQTSTIYLRSPLC